MGLSGTFGLRGDVLYWKSKQAGSDYTTKPDSIFTVLEFSKRPLVAPNFAWEPGFRLTADWAFANTGWLVGLQATRYSGKAGGTTKVGDMGGIFPALSFEDNTLPTDYATSARARWRLHTTLLDLFGAYEWRASPHFSLTPSLSARNAWISQHLSASYKGATFSAGTDHVKLRSSFYGVGPRIGLEPRWLVDKNVSLYVEGAGAVLCGWFDVRQKETFLSTTTAFLHRSPSGIRWSADVIAGIAWKYSCSPEAAIKAYAFDLGFDYLYFSKQYMFRHGPQFSLRSQNTYLVLYGAHASARLQF